MRMDIFFYFSVKFVSSHFITIILMLDFPSQKKLLEPILRHSTNHICADCDTRSPTWASLDFGVFLCSNCSGAHRALGPTITRVKSANLDLWHEDWLANMVLGNEQINAYWQADLSYNARKPKMGASPQEIRRYVLEKYVKKKYVKDSAQQDPLTAFKKKDEKHKHQEIHQNGAHSLETLQELAQQTKEHETTSVASQHKRQISLLQFDVELHPPPNQPANPPVSEAQFTSYTECGTSFTSETSKDNFVDFNTLLQAQRQAHGISMSHLHHSLSSQAVFQHNSGFTAHNPLPTVQQSLGFPEQAFHQSPQNYAHQNYFQHPYPPFGHHSPPNYPNNSSTVSSSINGLQIP